MADTASQKAPPRKTLQDEIDYQTSEAGGRMTTFIIKSKDGECSLPNFVNAKLIGCKIESLNVVGASIVYFEDCTVGADDGAFNVINSTVLSVGGTKFTSPVTFLNSKVEVRDCEIGQTFTLVDTSSIKSINNTWKNTSSKSKIALSLDNGSRAESYNDSWTKVVDCFWKATKNSFIKVINPKTIDHASSDSTTRGLAILDDSSVLVISHPKEISFKDNTTTLFTGTKNSRFELYNFTNLISDSILFDLTNSKAIIRNGTKLVSNKNKLGSLTDSSIDFSNISNFNSSAQQAIDTFTLVRSNITFGNTSSIKAQGIIFNLDQSNINFVSNSFDYKSDSAVGVTLESENNIAIKATNSKMFFKNIKSIKSGTNQAISMTGSSFYGTNITDIKSGSSGDTITSDTSYLSLVNVKTVSGLGDNGIKLTKSKGSLLNVDTVKSEGSQGAGIRCIDNSSVVCRNMTTINGPDDGIFLDVYSSILFKGKTAKITGQNTSGISVGVGCRVSISEVDTVSCSKGNGINGLGAKARLELKDIKHITGNSSSGIGLNVTGADLLLDNSGLDSSDITGGGSSGAGIKLASSAPLGTYKAVIVGPISVNSRVALDATGYQITEQGVAWNGDTTTTNCITNGMLSSVSGNAVTSQGHTKNIRYMLSKNLSLSNNASIELLSSSVGGDTTLDGSFIRSILSTLNNASLTSRSGIDADTSNIADVTLSDSFIRSFASNVGTVSQSGLSSAFGGASQSITLNFSSGDATYNSPVAFLTASGGDLAFQADNVIRLAGQNYEAKFRGTSTQESTGATTVKSNSSNVLIQAPSGAVNITAGSQIVSTVSASSITLNPASISIISTAVDINP